MSLVYRIPEQSTGLVDLFELLCRDATLFKRFGSATPVEKNVQDWIIEPSVETESKVGTPIPVGNPEALTFRATFFYPKKPCGATVDCRVFRVILAPTPILTL